MISGHVSQPNASPASKLSAGAERHDRTGGTEAIPSLAVTSLHLEESGQADALKEGEERTDERGEEAPVVKTGQCETVFT